MNEQEKKDYEACFGEGQGKNSGQNARDGEITLICVIGFIITIAARVLLGPIGM